MRILVAYPGHAIATIDVAIGYEAALRELGYDVAVYNYHDSLVFYQHAMRYWEAINPSFSYSEEDWLRLASEMLVLEVVRTVPDVVLMFCGFATHKSAFELIGRNMRIPIALVLTESPYLDENQRVLLEQGYVALAFCNEKNSVGYLGENRSGVPVVYLPHSYNPERHHPAPAEDGYTSDVFFCGTMYQERQDIIAQIDRGGIDLRVIGPRLGDNQVEGGIDNEELTKWYHGTKVGLNIHRTSCGVFDDRLLHIPEGIAYSLGPRAYELAGCGAFQLCDDSRGELREVFGDSVPAYNTAGELNDLIKKYLADDVARRELARLQHEAVEPCTFRARAEAILLPAITAEVL